MEKCRSGTDRNTKNSLNYGNLSPQNRIYQSFCGGFFSLISMVLCIEARKFFLEAMMNTEGAERERYANVYFGIIKGLDFCTDSDDE